MKRSTFKLQGGIGLIEVLIAMVVVAVGLVAVATLQGHLMSDSGDNKTRSEALALAERKIEELRNNANVAGYQAITAGATTEQNIVGTNATFTRTSTITDVAGFSTIPRKNISVQVSWDGNGNGVVDANERVEVITQMAWIDPAKSATLAAINAGAGTAQVPSPRQNASEDVAAEQVLNTEWTDVQSGGTPGTSTTMTVEVTNPTTHNVVSVELRQIAPGSHYYATADTNLFFVSPGVIAVFLCYPAGEGGADLSSTEGHCKYIQNHFGGIPLRIAGTVYSTSGNGLDNIQVAWTSSDVNACYNGPKVRHPSSGTLIYDSMPYECVLAGNCNATPGGATSSEFGATGCYPDNQVSDAQINARHVGPGGEYGDVGLLGVDDQGGNREQVCFLEDTTDPATSVLLQASGSEVQNENYLFAVTNRFYAARRISRDGSTANKQDSEGINRSYTNHNFLIIARGTGASANQRCKIAATANSIQLAPRDIIRTLNESGAPNEVLAETAYNRAATTAKTFTGTVTSDATNLRFYIPEVGACYLNNNNSPQTTPTAYACAIAGDIFTPSGSSIDIKGGSKEFPTSIPAAFAACNKTTDSTVCNWHNNFVTTSATSCQTPWGATIADGGTTTAYLNAVEPFGGSCQSETRTCTTGTLSGTYTNQSCTVSTSADCTTPWGTSVPNGSAVTAYANATVPTGFTCTDNHNSESRTCTNGILSGSYTNVSCAVQTTRNISVSVTTSGTGSVSGITFTSDPAGVTCSGLICTAANDWTGTLTATGSCSGGGTVTGTSGAISATATTASIALGNCTGPVCTTPWSTSLASGGSVTAYSADTVLAPAACSSIRETRFCNDGVLSGTYTHQNCSVIPTYSITVNAANGSGSVTSSSCGGGACTGLIAGTYTVSATLSGGSSCSKSYTIGANTTVTVTKPTGQGTTCSMSP